MPLDLLLLGSLALHLAPMPAPVPVPVAYPPWRWAVSRSIGAEATVAAAVLGVTAVLATTPTPPPHRAALAAAADPHAGHAAHPASAAATGRGGITVPIEPAGGIAGLVAVSPGRAGPNRVAVTLPGRANGAPLVPSEVWIELAHEATGIAPIRRRLQPTGPGRFVHEGPELALPGRWTVRVEALVGDFDLLAWTAGVEIRGPDEP